MAIPALHLLWRGATDSDEEIFSSIVTDRLPNFQPQKPEVNFYGSKSKVGMVALSDRILAVTTVNEGIPMSFNLYQGSAWGQPTSIYGSGTSWATALTAWGTGALMVWNGVGSDTRIWCSQYNHAGNDFSTQYLTSLPGNTPIKSASTPAIVNFNGTLLMVWRGEGDNDSLYYAKSRDGHNWTGNLQIFGAASTIAPSLAIYNGVPVVAFKGGRNDNSIYICVYNNAVDKWSGVTRTGPFGTSHGPSLCVYHGQLFMTWKASGGDTDLWWSVSSDLKAWSGQANISDTGSTVGPSCVVF